MDDYFFVAPDLNKAFTLWELSLIALVTSSSNETLVSVCLAITKPANLGASAAYKLIFCSRVVLGSFQNLSITTEPLERKLSIHSFCSADVFYLASPFSRPPVWLFLYSFP